MLNAAERVALKHHSKIAFVRWTKKPDAASAIKLSPKWIDPPSRSTKPAIA